VALLVGGATYVATRDTGNGASVDAPRHHVPRPVLPPLQTDSGNHAMAVQTTDRISSATPVYPGARRAAPFRFPQLSDSRLATPLVSDDTVVRTRLWSVSGVTPRTVAQWYADHAPRGFRTAGGHDGVGSEGSGPGIVYELTWRQPPGDRLPPVRPWVQVFATDVGGRVGIRVTIYTPWPPARPVASYVQDVRSIDVQSVHTHYGHVVQRTTRSTRVTAPGRLLRAATTFNDLRAEAPVGPINCPAIHDVYTDRIVFHTATGDVLAVATDNVGCLDGVTVHRDGHQVGPTLDDPTALLRVLGIRH
jgi:hypothetical protein